VSAGRGEATPRMQQYRELEARHPYAIPCCRMADSYGGRPGAAGRRTAAVRRYRASPEA
jgi:hypothetical protein